MNPKIIFVAFFGLFLIPACTADELLPDEPDPEKCESLPATYDTNVKEIIDANCAFSGCHVAGFPNGNFTTYDGMRTRLENGSIFTQVVVQRSMPLGFSLSQEDLDLLDCWLSNGFPEN